MSRILITAGPTREAVDPVRFFSNRSSGKMGFALAEAAIVAGHHVTLVHGPVSLYPPQDAQFQAVTSAQEMCDAVLTALPDHDVLIMCAAVADYTPVAVADQKLKKADGNLVIELKRTKDILKEVAKIRRTDQTIVGFAAETQNLATYARKKLEEKNLNWIIANDVSASDRGFAGDQNAATLFGRDGSIKEFPLTSKSELAQQLIKALDL